MAGGWTRSEARRGKHAPAEPPGRRDTRPRPSSVAATAGGGWTTRSATPCEGAGEPLPSLITLVRAVRTAGTSGLWRRRTTACDCRHRGYITQAAFPHVKADRAEPACWGSRQCPPLEQRTSEGHYEHVPSRVSSSPNLSLVQMSQYARSSAVRQRKLRYARMPIAIELTRRQNLAYLRWSL